MNITSDKQQKQWTLQQGLDFIRSINSIALSHGFYIGLGGSVLLTGYSENDIDIILAPLSGKQLDDNQHEQFLAELVAMNFIGPSYGVATDGRLPEDKIVVVSWLQSKQRVDFFFPTFIHKDRSDTIPNVEDLDSDY